MGTKRLEIQIPSQGWEQLLTGRNEILDAYDRARRQAKSHEVEVFHGSVVEAEFRKWLSRFLPARYGVTSGYVVSPGLSSKEKTPHFDVIIYDALESPVLWVEPTPDASEQGWSRAIPVEYVRCVIEIKSSFTRKNVIAAIRHLRDLRPLMSGIDETHNYYKLHLPSTFHCGCVFAELRVQDASTHNALRAMLRGLTLRGYFGGLILRGESHTLPQTGRVALAISEPSNSDKFNPKTTPLLEVGMTRTVQLRDGSHVGAMLTWNEAAFSEFAFVLLAMIKGEYSPDRRSSFYGLGNSWLEFIAATRSKGLK